MCRQSLDVRAALEKRSGHAVARQHFQKRRRAFAGPVIEGERERPAIPGAVPNRGAEHSRRASTHGPGRAGNSGGSSDGRGYAPHHGLFLDYSGAGGLGFR